MSAPITSSDTAAIPVLLMANYPDLDAAAVNELIDLGRLLDIPAGQKLFRGSDQCGGVMWLLEGSVRVHRQALDGREMTIYRVVPGDLCILSLSTLFNGGTYAAEACSETRLLGLAIAPQDMLALVDRNTPIRRLVLRFLSRRLQDVIEAVSVNAFDRLELRLACLLGQRFGQQQSNLINVTHQELANDLGCTREMTSRLLKDFERMGCIRLGRAQIELLSQQALEQLTGRNG